MGVSVRTTQPYHERFIGVTGVFDALLRLAPGIIEQRLQNNGGEVAAFSLIEPQGADVGVIDDDPRGGFAFKGALVFPAGLAAGSRAFATVFAHN